MAWEQGENLGHLARLGAVARQLRLAGATLSWVVPAARVNDVRMVAPGELVQAAPRLALRSGGRGSARSFAEVLLGLGWGDTVELGSALSAWMRLLGSSSDVDAVVLDYAPAAQLAACLIGLPAIQLTNGFDSPPPNMPPFGWGIRGPWVEAACEAARAAIDKCIQQISAGIGARRTVNDWLSYPLRLLDTLPALDPYGPREGFIAVGPLGQPESLLRAAWPNTGAADADTTARVFVYLRYDSLLEQVLQLLTDQGVAVLCYCPNAPDELLARQEWACRIERHPIDLSQLLHEADAVVSHGSSTLTCQTVLAGKPQLLIPGDVEKWMVARQAASMGIAVVVHGNEQLVPAVRTLLDGSLSDPWRRHAVRWTDEHWRRPLDWALRQAMFPGTSPKPQS